MIKEVVETIAKDLMTELTKEMTVVVGMMTEVIGGPIEDETLQGVLVLLDALVLHDALVLLDVLVLQDDLAHVVDPAPTEGPPARVAENICYDSADVLLTPARFFCSLV